jgi:hypothetical protein
LATLLAGAAMALLWSSDGASAATTCDRVASPSGSDGGAGTLQSPYRSAQKLVDSLAAGQTGCLRAGTYTQLVLSFHHGGSSGAPVTLTSYPGERATVSGGTIEIPHGSDFVSLRGINVDGADRAEVTIVAMAFDTVIEDSDITNRNAGTQCMILGNNRFGTPSGRLTIQRNRIHDCGRFSAGDQEHAIYFESTTDTRVVDNLIWGSSGFAIHLYPNGQRNLVAHNVIDGNRYGVVVGGDDKYASSGNTIAYNLITNTATRGSSLRTSWEGPVGTGNQAHHNCVFNGEQGVLGSEGGLAVLNTLVADPLYVDRANHDYRLRPGSPCLAIVGYDTAAALMNPPASAAPPVAAAPAPKAAGRWRLRARRAGRKNGRQLFVVWGRPLRGKPVRGKPHRDHGKRQHGKRQHGKRQRGGQSRVRPRVRARIVVSAKRQVRARRTVKLRRNGRLRARISTRLGRRVRTVKLRAHVRGAGWSAPVRVRVRARR